LCRKRLISGAGTVRFVSQPQASIGDMRTPNGLPLYRKEAAMPDISDAPVTKLDPRRVGEILIRLPAVAAALRHDSVQSTLGYSHPLSEDGDPELEFVRAILAEDLDEVHQEWYGGSLNASRMAADLMDQVIDSLRSNATVSEP
jgi:hypothetical protein